MAYGVIKNNSVLGIEEEVTQGTYVAPAAATSYVQPLSDGLELSGSKEVIDRALLTGSPGKPTPRLGIEGSQGSIPVEFRASGIEGGQTDFHSLIKAALGAVRAVASNITTKSGHSASTIMLDVASYALVTIGDIFVVKESAAHQVVAVLTKTNTAPASAKVMASGSDIDNGTETFTSVAHGMSNGQKGEFTTSNTLPVGLALATTYYVINVTADTFQVSLTSGGAAVNITTNGTGNQTFTPHNNQITVTPNKTTGSWTAAVVLSKVQMYYTAATGHVSLSVSEYIGNEIRAAVAGAKVTGLSLESYETGKVASLKFAVEGFTYIETNGVAPHTPTFDTSLPPIILSSCVYRAGTEITVNNATVSLTNKLGYITSTCSANGKISSRVVEREVVGTFNPYKDDTAVGNYTDWKAGTEFSVLIFAQIPSAVAGEFTMGSVVAIWLPTCVTTGYKVGDKDGISTDEVEFRASRGAAGTTEEMYLGTI